MNFIFNPSDVLSFPGFGLIMVTCLLEKKKRVEGGGGGAEKEKVEGEEGAKAGLGVHDGEGECV